MLGIAGIGVAGWVLGGDALAADVLLSPGDDVATLTSSLLPGDIVSFSAGTYELPGSIYWTGVGTEDAPITFRASPDAEVVLQNLGGGPVASLENASFVVFEDLVFEGGGPDLSYTQPSGLRIAESSQVEVRNCVIRNVWGTGLRIDGNTHHIWIHDVEISGTGDGSGIYVGCYDASCWMQESTIEHNLVHDVQGAGLSFSTGTQSSIVRDNVVFRTRDEGLYAGATALGPQNQILGNAIWQTGGDGLSLRGAALVQNNVVFETGGDAFYTRNDESDGLADLQVSHNTFANADGYAAYLENWFDREGMVFANNALANPLGRGLRWDDPSFDPYGGGSDTGALPETGNYVSNNVVTGLVYGFDPLSRPGFVLPGGGVGDFQDLDAFDFYPSGSSVLRDAADPSGEAYLPAVDFNGTVRDGGSPDVGAYEYAGPTNPGWILAEDFKSTAPPGASGGGELSSGCCGKNESGGTEAALLLPALGLGVLRRRRRR